MLVFIGMMLVIIAQLANLQLFSDEYKIMADDQGKFRKVIYPDRGLVFDRNKKTYTAKCHYIRPDDYAQ